MAPSLITIQLFDQTGDAALCAALPSVAAALQRQCNEHFAGPWNKSQVAIEVPTMTGSAAFTEVPREALASTTPDAWPCFIVPELDDPQALAYHTTAQGKPVLYVGRNVVMQNGGTISSSPVSISSAASHEILETLGDPFADFWSNQPNLPDSPLMVALEACDPVEGDSYDIDGIAVSNFVMPEWFRAGSASSYDYLAKLTNPGTLSPGGYVVFSDGTQKFGSGIAAWRANHVRSHSRRLRRRRRIISV
jgi:hypothetical protein